MDAFSLFFGSGNWGVLLLQGALRTVAVAAAGLGVGAVFGVALASARIAGGPG